MAAADHLEHRGYTWAVGLESWTLSTSCSHTPLGNPGWWPCPCCPKRGHNWLDLAAPTKRAWAAMREAALKWMQAVSALWQVVTQPASEPGAVPAQAVILWTSQVEETWVLLAVMTAPLKGNQGGIGNDVSSLSAPKGDNHSLPSSNWGDPGPGEGSWQPELQQSTRAVPHCLLVFTATHYLRHDSRWPKLSPTARISSWTSTLLADGCMLGASDLLAPRHI